VFYGEDPAEPEARVALPANDFQPSAQTNEEAEANIKAYLERAEAFWAEQATSEQREMRAELNDEGSGESGENLWHYLDEAQQQSLLQELQGDGA
jgi:type VI secretion system secreted protein VgrG